jgi:hypothetical protein
VERQGYWTQGQGYATPSTKGRQATLKRLCYKRDYIQGVMIESYGVAGWSLVSRIVSSALKAGAIRFNCGKLRVSCVKWLAASRVQSRSLGA